MAIFQSLEFDGANSLDSNVYITGESVYNAPERDTESVAIPGRSGDMIIDKGRWNNIEVTYPAGAFGSSQTEFSDTMRQFRNLLASKVGYKRLTDTYHPDEYRMAVYKGGIEVDPAHMSTAGEFDITFDCKPQRFLTSGEADNTIADGGTLSNPTMYESNPLLKVEGYGNIAFNGYSIDLENKVMGVMQVARASATSYTATRPLESEKYNSGDTLTVAASESEIQYVAEASTTTATSANNVSGGSVTIGTTARGASFVYVKLTMPAFTFTAGTDASVTNTVAYRLAYSENGTAKTKAMNASVTRTYTASDETLVTQVTALVPVSGFRLITPAIRTGAVTADSTATILGHPTYIDCDLGECYKIVDGSVVGLNSYIDLGSNLPTLAPGENTFTYDNTVTELKVVPRWWIL